MYAEERLKLELNQPSGKRVRRSTGTTNKKAAQELHDRLKHAVQMALATSLRSGEILKMEWSEVDLKRRVAWIPAEKAERFYTFELKANTYSNLLLT